MAHTHLQRKPLLARVRRIRGQIEAVERLLDADADCDAVLQTIAACRGALGALMYQVIDGHVRTHVIDPTRKPSREQLGAAEELLRVLRTYIT